MKILVCGGRDFSNKAYMFSILDDLHESVHIAAIIHGGAKGADTIADEWAAERNVTTKVFRAEWKKTGVEGAVIKNGQYGPYNAVAGHQRNTRMLEEGKPDIIVAFAGGNGTKNMVNESVKRGFKVYTF